MKKKRNFLLKSILLQLNFSLEKAGILLVLVLVFSIQAKAYSQTRITAKRQGVTIDEVLKEVREKSGYRFLYRVEEVNRYGKRDIDVKDAEVEDFLGQLLQNTDLTYEVENEVIIIRPEKQRQDSRVNVQVVRGKVTDENNLALPGATVLLKGTSYGVVTDSHGKFTMEVLERDTVTLLVSFVGMETRLVNLKKGQTEILVSLEPDIKEMKEVVVTGYGNVRKTSFTGNSVTVTKDELMSVSKSNVIKALQTFDPSFRIQTNNDWGSDPNALPEMYVRGRSGISGVKELDRDPLTKSALKDNPNLPTFIMDGFQISVEQLYDMDPNRIESITILKDAAATALYGSRAANGVVVITTVAPQMGKLNVSYNFTGDVTVPDLSDYNLMNAREKLETEVAAGVFEDLAKDNPLGAEQQYYAKLASITRGVDTYWLSKPLQTSFNHKHSLSVDGGSDNFRFGIQLSYNNEDGVMKESFRRTFNGGINLSYKTSELIFRNQLTISLNKAQESPYGTFDEYVKLNPYWTATDENGNIKRFFDEDYEYWGGSYPANPLYNATLNTKETSDYTNITNNFSMEWKPIQEFTLRGTFGIYTQTSNTDNYLPPEHTSFADYTDENYFRRGSYDYSTNKSSRYNFSLTANYSKVFAEKHMVYAGLNMDLEDQRSRGYSFSVEGFPSGSLDFLSVAMQYKENGKPGGSESKSRRVGFVGNASYSFEDRYFVDASFRTDGSSLYGSDRRFAPFWSAGIGWNIHREGFMSDVDWINRLKIRASVGETGSNNFSSYEAMATYAYSLSDRYYNWMGANMKALANPDLEWQKTMKYNAGIEVNMLNNRLSMICDLYLERTNGLMSSLELPPSNGFSSYKANIGKLENKGFELKVTGYLLRDTERELIWSVTGSLVRNKDKIIELSEAMKEANATLLETGGATPNKIWQEGDSQNAIYAVRSLGIDPSNGRELFLKKNGEVTYTWDANDRVFCGVDQPDYRGNINTMFMWKDLSVNLSFGYEWGGQQYNSTLISRVENADKKYNVDRRVYEDRWKEPGDRTFFKGINETTATQATSRFVQDEATFTCQNLNVTYDLKGNKWLKRNLGIQTLTLKGDIADLFRISTIKQERGTSYPFSRQFSFTLSAMF